MKEKAKVVNFNNSNFVPDRERVLITTICRDFSQIENGLYSEGPAVLTENGFQDGFGEYTTHLPEEYRFYTNQPSYGLSFLQANVEGPTWLQYPLDKDLEAHLSSGNYDVLGISAYTWSLPWAKKLAAKAKKKYGIKEVWLGCYAVMTEDPEMAKFFDRLFWGYSESTLNQAIGGDEIPVDKIKHPDLRTNTSFLGKKATVGHVIYRRGCPNRCSYCSDPVFHPGGQKPLSIETIEKTLDYYKECGLKSIYFSNQDTTLFNNLGMKVIDSLHERDFRFGMLTSFKSLNAKGPDGIKMLHDKGFRFLLIGLESLNDKNLIKNRRRSRFKEMYDTMKLLQDLKIMITTTYMICFEDDTPESIREAKKIMINDLGVTVSLFNITMPLPSTPMYWQYKKDNLILDWDWTHWTGNHLLWRHPNISTKLAQNLLAEMRSEVNSPVYNPNVKALWNSRKLSVAANAA
jgi:radical SAM superfamily enzyme YgiQ (UPF0313 family)